MLFTALRTQEVWGSIEKNVLFSPQPSVLPCLANNISLFWALSELDLSVIKSAFTISKFSPNADAIPASALLVRGSCVCWSLFVHHDVHVQVLWLFSHHSFPSSSRFSLSIYPSFSFFLSLSLSICLIVPPFLVWHNGYASVQGARRLSVC